MYGPILLYLKPLAWRGNLDRRSGLQQDNTPHGQLGVGGRGEVGDRGGMGTAGGGRGIIWDCLNKSVRSISHWGPCGNAVGLFPLPQRHLSPPERPFDHRPKDRKKECFPRKYLRDCSERKSFLANYSSRRHLGRKQLNKLSAVCGTSDLCVSARLCEAVSSRHARVKTQMVRCNKHGPVFLAHIKGMALVFYFIGAAGHECVHPGSQVGFTRAEREACFHLVWNAFLFYFPPCNGARQRGGAGITEATGSREGIQVASYGRRMF